MKFDKLNLGCGFNKIDGFVNVDMFDACNPDVLHNLEITPWPFPENTVNEIVLNHSLEHLGKTTDAFLEIIKEIYRISKNGATVRIIVPHPRHDNFLNDPTHIRSITPGLFDMLSLDNCNAYKKIGASNTPLAIYLNVDFVILNCVTMIEEKIWEKHKSGEIDQQELHNMVHRQNNVATEFNITLQVKKN